MIKEWGKKEKKRLDGKEKKGKEKPCQARHLQGADDKLGQFLGQVIK
jgi:hypothetical protein